MATRRWFPGTVLAWRQILGSAALAIVALAAAGCVTMSVSSHLQPGVNFSQYRTWDWGPADNLPMGDPRLDNNTIFKDRLLGAVEKAFAARGFERAAAGATPDMLMHYHANVSQRIQIDEPENCAVDCRPSIVEYDQGTLVLDLMEARSGKLLWRAWAQDSVQGVIDNQAVMERQIDEAVAKMMATFPAGL
jgi:hypothetical protein